MTLFEDAACSLGATIDGKPTGSYWTTCFSFHPRKLITCGEGGIVTTNQKEVAEAIRKLKNFGDGGGNYKLDDIKAAIAIAQMQKLDSIIEKRVAMAHVYDDLLGSDPLINIPQKHPQAKHTYQTYAVYVMTPNRDEIIRKLALKGIETQVGAYALHLLPQFQHLKRVGDLRNSELLSQHLLALPMDHQMNEEDQKFVIDELTKTCHN